MRAVLEQISLPKKSIRSSRIGYSIFSPIAFGRVLAPIAVFALIFILTSNDTPVVQNENTEIALTTSDTSFNNEARMVKTFTTVSVTPEEKRERAKAVIALLDEATPTTKQEEVTYTNESEPSLSALYE